MTTRNKRFAIRFVSATAPHSELEINCLDANASSFFFFFFSSFLKLLPRLVRGRERQRRTHRGDSDVRYDFGTSSPVSHPSTYRPTGSFDRLRTIGKRRFVCMYVCNYPGYVWVCTTMPAAQFRSHSLGPIKPAVHAPILVQW